MNLLEKLERKWMMHETLHQLKDTLKRYGMNLTTPLSRIDKDYSSGHYSSTALSLIHYTSIAVMNIGIYAIRKLG